ncbi:pogo transposable element with KRAB domain-like protein [Aphelenchoides avenae]|nr:pogo transposable element with KRAB domain-like protein [Aphelenchus avenae]
MSNSEASVDNDATDTTSSGRKMKEYSVKFKLQVVEWATANRNNNGVHAGKPNMHAAAKHFGVSRKNVRRWVAQAAKLKERKEKKGGTNAKNLPGQGRPIKNKDFEKQLNDWVREGREGRHKVTRDLIVARAKQLQEKMPEDRRLNLSDGWLQKFMKRNKWTLRAPTSVAQKPPADYQDRVVKFVIAVEAMRKQNKFHSKHVYGADETGVWINPTGGLCVEQIGRKDVTVLSAGNAKLRITVMLTARSDGKREKPFVLMPFGPNARCKKEVDKKFGNKLHLIWMDTTWMNNPITAIYLKKLFGGLFKPKRLLVWDQFSAHKGVDTQAVLKQLKLEMVLVPAGCTRFVQPADVSWNAPFKRKLRSLYNQWMLVGDHQTTAAGNPKPPQPETYLQWVLDAWDAHGS